MWAVVDKLMRNGVICEGAYVAVCTSERDTEFIIHKYSLSNIEKSEVNLRIGTEIELTKYFD